MKKPVLKNLIGKVTQTGRNATEFFKNKVWSSKKGKALVLGGAAVVVSAALALGLGLGLKNRNNSNLPYTPPAIEVPELTEKQEQEVEDRTTIEKKLEKLLNEVYNTENPENSAFKNLEIYAVTLNKAKGFSHYDMAIIVTIPKSDASYTVIYSGAFAGKVEDLKMDEFAGIMLNCIEEGDDQLTIFESARAFKSGFKTTKNAIDYLNGDLKETDEDKIIELVVFEKIVKEEVKSSETPKSESSDVPSDNEDKTPANSEKQSNEIENVQ